MEEGLGEFDDEFEPPADPSLMAPVIPTTPPGFKSGFVGLVGRPNAGKSTLLNACLGEKAAITSPVAQTTRKRLRAVVNRPDAQIILVDTPGIHKPKDRLGEELNRTSLAEIQDVDVACLLIDGTKRVGRGDQWVARELLRTRAPKILVITKADKASPEQVTEQLEAAHSLGVEFSDAIALSAKTGFNVDGFLTLLTGYLPEGPRWFPESMSVEATEEDLFAEFIREKVLLNCRDEIPHAVGVLVDSIEDRPNGVVAILATVYVERDSQKGIIVGKGGSMIRKIGTEARLDIERYLGERVFLSLSVKVKDHWRRDANAIRRFGYEAE